MSQCHVTINYLVTLVFVSRRAHGEREAVDGEGEDDGRALLRRDGVQRLQVSQLEDKLNIHLLQKLSVKVDHFVV